MPINREFIYAQNDEVGFWGLRPTWMKLADPTTGRGCAHDMLEHFATKDNPFEGELKALGALYVLRYESGAMPMYGRTVSQQMTGVVKEVLKDMVLLSDVPLPRPRKLRGLNDLPEEALRGAVELAYAELEPVLQDARSGSPPSEDERTLAEVEAVKENVLAWMLVGYRKAYQRYRATDPYTIGNQLFPNVARKVEDLLRSESLQPGALVRVSANIQNGYSVAIRVKQPGSRTWVPADRLH